MLNCDHIRRNDSKHVELPLPKYRGYQTLFVTVTFAVHMNWNASRSFYGRRESLSFFQYPGTFRASANRESFSMKCMECYIGVFYRYFGRFFLISQYVPCQHALAASRRWFDGRSLASGSYVWQHNQTMGCKRSRMRSVAQLSPARSSVHGGDIFRTADHAEINLSVGREIQRTELHY